jgi:hypothetical protein
MPLLVKALVGILINTYENNIKGMHNIVFKMNGLDPDTMEPIVIYGFNDPVWVWNESNLSEKERNIDYFLDHVYLPIVELYETATLLANLRLKYSRNVNFYSYASYLLSGTYLILAALGI